MIEQQVRPWDVLDQSVLDLLFVVNARLRAAQYRPCVLRYGIPLRIDGSTPASPVVAELGRILQEIAIKRHDLVSEIGTGSYMAALLAHKAAPGHFCRNRPEAAGFGAANLARAGVHNVSLESGDASRGWPGRAPYDVIVVTGSLPVLPDILRRQLKVGGRLAAVIGSDPIMSAQLITRVSETGFDAVTLFETRLKPLRNAERPSSFRF
jgi:protein-L-isoaspartate(D-aspartate) O-methyltransferase